MTIQGRSIPVTVDLSSLRNVSGAVAKTILANTNVKIRFIDQGESSRVLISLSEIAVRQYMAEHRVLFVPASRRKRIERAAARRVRFSHAPAYGAINPFRL